MYTSGRYPRWCWAELILFAGLPAGGAYAAMWQYGYRYARVMLFLVSVEQPCELDTAEPSISQAEFGRCRTADPLDFNIRASELH